MSTRYAYQLLKKQEEGHAAHLGTIQGCKACADRLLLSKQVLSGFKSIISSKSGRVKLLSGLSHE